MQVLSRSGEAVFRVAVPSSVYRVYVLESTSDLAAPVWQTGPLVAGTGHVLELTDTSGAAQVRFYRVRRW